MLLLHLARRECLYTEVTQVAKAGSMPVRWRAPVNSHAQTAYLLCVHVEVALPGATGRRATCEPQVVGADL